MIPGLSPFGEEPVGSDTLHDPPSTTVTAPTGTVSSGGPDITTEWTFSQPQGDIQAWYRVRATNDAGTVEYHDSGWLHGAANTYDLDVGEAPGVPGDSSDVTIQVDVRGPDAIGMGTVARYQATDGEPIIVALGNPHLTIDAPLDGAIHIDPAEVFVDWTFTDDVAGKTQAHYRVRLLSVETGQVLTSTGWVASTAEEATVTYQTSDGSRITVEVQAKNNEGILTD